MKTTIAISTALLLVACAKPDPLDSAIERAEVVKKCADGTYLGRDPATGRLVFARASFAYVSRGFVAAGVKPEDFCK